MLLFSKLTEVIINVFLIKDKCNKNYIIPSQLKCNFSIMHAT